MTSTGKATPTGEATTPSLEKEPHSQGQNLRNRPTRSASKFTRNWSIYVLAFVIRDLLRASAEVLGKWSVGTSYKAVLEEGMTVVVKRLKDVVAGKREFEAQMEVLGKSKLENVVPLRAFYFSKDEKLLVYDYLPNGSLSALLHGGQKTAIKAINAMPLGVEKLMA